MIFMDVWGLLLNNLVLGGDGRVEKKPDQPQGDRF